MDTILYRMLLLNRFENIQDPYNNPTGKEVIDTSAIHDPLRDGAEAFSHGVGWIKNAPVWSFDIAKNTLLTTIQLRVNRFMWFLALIALIYLIVQGIQFLLSPKDEDIKKLTGRLTNTLWALWWIGLSRLIVSFIFYVIGIVTK